jgi:hypothetical protein
VDSSRALVRLCCHTEIDYSHLVVEMPLVGIAAAQSPVKAEMHVPVVTEGLVGSQVTPGSSHTAE